MRNWILGATALAITAAVTMTSGPQQANASAPVCLKVRDLGTLTQVDDTTLKATSRSQGDFIVKLRSPCTSFKWMSNPYTIKLYGSHECFDGDDVIEFSTGGPCFVQTVTPAPKN